jgi:hypothetical protein
MPGSAPGAGFRELADDEALDDVDAGEEARVLLAVEAGGDPLGEDVDPLLHPARPRRPARTALRTAAGACRTVTAAAAGWR